MKKDSRIERVLKMETRYNDVKRMLDGLEKAVADYETLRYEIDVLNEYMSSGQWQKDFEADEAGKIPKDIRRGVLSEDGLYNLLENAGRIVGHAREIFS